MASQVTGVHSLDNNLKVNNTHGFLFWHDVGPVVMLDPGKSDRQKLDDINSQLWWSPFVDAEK